MSEIRTRPATKEYRDNWDAIFGAKKSPEGVTDEEKKLKVFEDTVRRGLSTALISGNYWNPTDDVEKPR